MTRSKQLMFSLLICSIISMTLCNKGSFLDSEADMKMRIRPTIPKLRNLHDHDDPEGLIAQLYPQPHFEGIPQAVLSGVTKRLYTETISFKVGLATLRIIDMENKWVYRFAPGEQVAELKLKTRNWLATLGKPRFEDDCVLFFQRPNYSGYFESFCLENANWFAGQLFDKRFTSFTLPDNDAVNYVAILGHMNEVQVFNYRSAFSGDLNYVYLFGAIPANRAYVFTARTVSNIVLVPEANPSVIPEGSSFLLAGTKAYAKLKDANAQIVFSKDRQFVHYHVGEGATAQVRDLDDIPADGSVALYDDADGFGLKTTVAYQANGDYPDVTNAKYIIFPKNDVSAVAFAFNFDKNTMTMRDSGRIPNEDALQITRMAIAPTVGDRKALIFSNPDFQGDQYEAAEGTIYGETDSIDSIVVGYGTDLYMVSTDKTDIVTFKSGTIHALINSLSGYTAFYDKNKMLEFITPVNCLLLFNSCDSFEEPQIICEHESENYGFIEHIHDVALISFPVDENSFIASALIYHPETFDGQISLVQSTCLKKRPSKGQRITIIPKVADNTVIYYDDTFYSGKKHELKNDIVSEIFDPTVEKISIALGKGGNVKIIDLEHRKIFHINFNTVKLHTHANDYYLQAGNEAVINESHSLWTFDDDSYNDMRILNGGVYYGENAVSYNSQYIVFPADQKTQKAILVDRRNSLIQTYNYQSGLVPIDHTTFGGVERILTIPDNWNNVLLCRYSDFGEYKAKMGRTEIVKLGNNRHYSFVSQGSEDLRIFSWPLLNNLKYEPKDAIINYPAEQLIERSFTVGLSGMYGFVVGNDEPVNVLYDCIITFDDCNNQSNIRRFCMRSRGILANTFEIPTPNTDKLKVIITASSEKYSDIKRKYAGVLFNDNYFMEQSECLSVPLDSYKFKFLLSKPE